MTDAIDSVLTSVKDALDIQADYTVFDGRIVMFINSVLADLQQIGVGLTDDTTEITDANDTWEDILTTQKNLGMIKSYIFLRVKLMFDPPQVGSVLASAQQQIDKAEWRIKVASSSTPNLPQPN